MARINNLFLVILATVMCALMSFAQAAAKDKEFSFNKDIQVVPVNERSETRININLSVDKTKIEPGDTVVVHFEPDKDCHLTLIDVGTSGKITRLWPNEFSGSDNFVKAHTRQSFPGPSDKFVFRVSGPKGIERIVAVATTKKNAILSDSEFGEYRGGFKSYQKGLKDLVVEASSRTDDLGENVRWGTAEIRLVIGNVPPGGSITSRNVFMVSVGAATLGLRYCDDDATSFARLMAGKLGIPEANMRILVGPQGTRARFVEAMRWLASRTKPEDLVLIYFSGHGTLIPDQPPVHHPDGLSAALVCFNRKQRLTIDDPDLKDILLVGADFGRLLKKLPARRRLIVIDSCHSGSITKEMSANLVSKYLPLLSPEQIKRIRREKRKEIQFVVNDRSSGAYSQAMTEKESLLAACAKPESSYEDKSKNAGLFTYWLANSIENQSPNLKVAFDKTRQNVLDETSSLTQRQTPQITDEYGLARDIKF
jgi:hypothetical protein